jgi:hypothetical protein
MIAGVPDQGGATWAVLQHVLGLQRLGHEVFLVEPVEAATLSSTRCSPSIGAFTRTVEQFGLQDRAALLGAGTRETVGLSFAALRDAARRADLLINVSGMLAEPELLDPIPRRVYLDLDPAFNQLWQVQGIDMRFAAHTHFVTVGLALGTDRCAVPTLGYGWIKTVPPVVLDEWPGVKGNRTPSLTTIGNWRAYGSIEHQGVFYGQKAHSFRDLLNLPSHIHRDCRLALAIDPGDRRDIARLRAGGWNLVDPVASAGTPDRYRSFVQDSWAELGVAKQGYITSQCGWFSDRSACYLASGRPVLAQQTGFSDYLPTGQGLLAFEDVHEAAAGVEVVDSDYERHARAAHELAHAYFDSDRVLTELLGRVGSLR